MTKRLKSKYKVCKKVKGLYKNIWGVAKSAKFRSIRILKRNALLTKLNFKRLSSFNKRLNVKQSLRSFYFGLSDKSFKKLLKKSIESDCKTINKLISLLESRIDIVLFRSCFVNSLHMARQLISHGFIYLNSKQICSKNVALFTNDYLEIKENKSFSYVKLLNKLKKRHFKQYYSLVLKNNQKIKNITKLVKILNKKNRLITPILNKSIFLLNKFKKRITISENLEISYLLFRIIFLWEPCLKTVYYPTAIQYKNHLKKKFFNYNEIIYND